MTQNLTPTQQTKAICCTLCGEQLTAPSFFKGQPYGWSCIEKVNPNKIKRSYQGEYKETNYVILRGSLDAGCTIKADLILKSGNLIKVELDFKRNMAGDLACYNGIGLAELNREIKILYININKEVWLKRLIKLERLK